MENRPALHTDCVPYIHEELPMPTTRYVTIAFIASARSSSVLDDVLTVAARGTSTFAIVMLPRADRLRPQMADRIAPPSVAGLS